MENKTNYQDEFTQSEAYSKLSDELKAKYSYCISKMNEASSEKIKLKWMKIATMILRDAEDDSIKTKKLLYRHK